jgi:hypothetical protein
LRPASRQLPWSVRPQRLGLAKRLGLGKRGWGVGRGGLLCGLALIVAAGCQRPADNVKQEESRLKPLMILYGQYIGQHRGKPPSNEQEFQAFVEESGPGLLESFPDIDAQSLFVSARDNKPFVILYGRVEGPPGPGGQPVVAYEQEGANGKRLVASNLGAVEEVDETRFRELVPDAK